MKISRLVDEDFILNILVIPDSHATPEHDNNRYDWLGNLIVDRKPDIIVDIGDHADMHSLSSYDKGKKSFEGRRYVEVVARSIKVREIKWARLF